MGPLKHGAIELGFEVERKEATPSLINQVHGKEILELEAITTARPDADGVSTRSNRPIHIFTADCLPVLMYSASPSEPVVAIHAGWRGAMKGIVAEGLKRFTNPGDTHVVFGPALGTCCFEVRQDFVDEFDRMSRNTRDYLETRGDSRFFSLVDFVVGEDLRQVPQGNIHRQYFKCTYCSPEQLPSYRRNKSTDPRIRSWIQKVPIYF